MLPSHLSWRWPIDRLVKRGIAGLSEIKTAWTIDDVMNQNELLDLDDEVAINRAEQQKAEAEAAKMEADMKRRMR